jgi:thioester reductase-like protein
MTPTGTGTESHGTVLITGATGFVGMEVLARYLERTERKIALLVRAESDDAARARVHAVLRNLFGRVSERYHGRVQAFAAELTAPGLGLSEPRRRRLAETTSTIIHGAASISFTLPLPEAREINLEGTRRMLELAELAQEHGSLRTYTQVSTAYVAGDYEGRFYERDLDVGQGFRNSYEQSKFESEQLVRQHRDLPFTILRPSIVVGDRRSGWTSAFNVLYWPLRAFSRGLLDTVPAIPSAPIDVVSIDYVADAIYELVESPDGTTDTYHLTAGPQCTTLGELAQEAASYFKRPPPVVLPPEEFAAMGAAGMKQSVAEGSAAYFPYFCNGTVFDESVTRARLDPVGIQVSPLPDYIGRLLDYATRSRWGKRPIARVEALAA